MFGFFLTPLRRSSLHCSIMRMSLEMILSTRPTEEHQDRVSVTAFRRHAASLWGIALAASVFWLSGAEAPASSVASASSYRCSKNVCILAIVVAKLKLREVQRKVFLADMVEAAHHTTLEKRPERFDVIGVHFAAHIFANGVLYGVVRVSDSAQIVVAFPFIRRDQISFVAYGLTYEAVERLSVRILNHLTDHVALPADRAYDCSFSAQAGYVFFLVPMAVLVLAVNASLVYFDD
jgi:hypothetical protein